MMVPGANVLIRAGDKMPVECEDILRHICLESIWKYSRGDKLLTSSIFDEVCRRGNPPMPKASADKDLLRQRLRRGTEERRARVP